MHVIMSIDTCQKGIRWTASDDHIAGPSLKLIAVTWGWPLTECWFSIGSRAHVSLTTIKASDTLEHQPTVWPVPYANAQRWTAVSALLGLDWQLRLIRLLRARPGRTAVRLPATDSSHMCCVKVALKAVLCRHMALLILFLSDGYAMLMRQSNAETAVHGATARIN